MGLLAKLNPFKGAIDNAIDGAIELADQAILDKDKLNEMRFKLYEAANELYLAELSTQTIPWVDALHKMGRQILSVLAIVAVVLCKVLGYELSPQEVALIGGPSLGYIIAKGSGKGL